MINIDIKEVKLMNTKIVSLILIIVIIFSYNALATGYTAGTASHPTLYADVVRGKGGSIVTVNDRLDVNIATDTAIRTTGFTALEALNSVSPTIRALLSDSNRAVSGSHTNGNTGYLGDSSYGAYGLNGAAGHYGYLGGGSYAAYGNHFNGHYGYLGGPSYGAYGRNANGNYGYMGGATYAVRGHCADASCIYGFYTSNKLYAGNGVDVGATAPCTDSSAAALCALNDIAEDIYSKDELEAGDVVVIDSENNEHVRLSNKPYDTMVAGIISPNPAFHIKSSDTGIPLALAGRVLAKASTENGPINRGDLLTTSSTKGHLMKCASREKCFGALVGKALEPLKEGKGKIMVLVTLG